MGVTDQRSEQPRQPEKRSAEQQRQQEQARQPDQRPAQARQQETRIKVRMGSRAVQHFHRRSPSQHRVLASIIDDMNKETRMKNLKMHKSSRVTNVPIDVEPMEIEQENVEEERRMGRPEKKVTWSRDLLQVRSISPRQKSPRTPKMADSARTSRMTESVNTLRGGPSSVTQEGADCGHFLCQRVGGVCLQQQGGGELQQGGGNLRPGFQATSTGYQATNTGYQAPSTDHQATPGYQKLPCSPQMQTVVWRSIPISRSSNNNNNNNNKRAGLTLDLGNAFLQGEG